MSPAIASLLVVVFVTALTIIRWPSRHLLRALNNRQRLAALTWHIGLGGGCGLPVWILTWLLWPQFYNWLPALGLLTFEGFVLGAASALLMLFPASSGKFNFWYKKRNRKIN